MFARSVRALLGFRACEFPAKSEKNPGHLFLTGIHSRKVTNTQVVSYQPHINPHR